jgi:hypothetical protein
MSQYINLAIYNVNTIDNNSRGARCSGRAPSSHTFTSRGAQTHFTLPYLRLDVNTHASGLDQQRTSHHLFADTPGNHYNKYIPVLRTRSATTTRSARCTLIYCAVVLWSCWFPHEPSMSMTTPMEGRCSGLGMQHSSPTITHHSASARCSSPVSKPLRSNCPFRFILLSLIVRAWEWGINTIKRLRRIHI